MYILRSSQLEQEFSSKEFDLAVAVGKRWERDGLRPVLYFRYNGKFVFYTHLLGQRLAA